MIRNLTVVLLFTFYCSVYSDLIAGVFYAYPIEYYGYSVGAKHDGMGGCGYSTNSTLNALSLSPSQLGFVSQKNESLSFEYGAASTLYNNDSIPFYIHLSQYLDIVHKIKGEKRGWMAYQLKDIAVISKDKFKQTKWDPSSQSIVELDALYRDNYNMLMFKVGYGTILPPKNRRIHSIGIALSSLWYHDPNFDDPLNYYKFMLDVGYSIHLANLLSIGISMKNISLGKTINHNSTMLSDSKLDVVYSIGLDSKLKTDYDDKNVNFSCETYLRRISNRVDEGTRFIDIFWGTGCELLFVNKIAFRNGFIWEPGLDFNNNKYEIPFGIGINLRKNVEVSLFLKRLISVTKFSKTDVNLIGSTESVYKTKDWQFGASVTLLGLGRR